MRIERLYLFTSVYPYGLKESYADNEVKVLSHFVREISIYPSFMQDGIKRNTAANIFVHSLLAEKPGRESSLSFLDCLMVFKILWQELRRSGMVVFVKYFRRNLGSLMMAIRQANGLQEDI